jgi:Uma2 family endonuclease
LYKNKKDMTEIAIQNPPVSKLTNGKRNISWEAFKRTYLEREDGYKYEWVNGQVEKTERGIDSKQLYILDNLLNLFDQLRFEGKLNGRLTPEIDTFFNDAHRRPDVAYYTKSQILAAAHDVNVVPQFVIEIISNTDQINRVHAKMQNYWAAEVPVIWHIFPLLKVVHVYHGKHMVVCEGEDICSAAPVLPDYQLSVNAIFAL